MKTEKADKPPVQVELTVSDGVNSQQQLPDCETISLWVNSAYMSDNSTVASMQIVTADEMKTLNKNYCGKDKATNVLSFPMDMPADVDVTLLGDIALCADVIISEAAEQNKKPLAHWAHMVVHGMLHLQGYDHIDERQADIMEALEIKILQQLGFDNPYSQTH